MKTKNFAEVIRRKLASDNNLAAAVDVERSNANVGSVIHEARTQADLTQKQLADSLGMHQSAIARLEDADYDGHSFKTLQRIAAALGKRIEVAFVDCSASQGADLIEEFYIDESSWEPETEPWQPNITEIATTSETISRNNMTAAI